MNGEDKAGAGRGLLERFHVPARGVRSEGETNDGASREEVTGDRARRRGEALHLAHLARSALTLVDAVDGEAQSTVVAAIRQGQEVEGLSRDMTGAIDSAVEHANEVSRAAHTTTDNVQGVAAATEEMTVSVHQIASLVERAEGIVGSAVSEAERAAQVIAGLTASTQAIDGIAALIDKIARQTNLLALNATIEANRAGAAGRGFAVVAEEVKVLAQQTATATRDIRRQIEDIRANSEEVVSVIGGIRARVAEIDEISQEIGHAVQQQAQANGEISRNAQQTAMDTAEVTANIASVAEEARTTRQLSDQVRQSVGSITQALGVMQRRMGVVISQFSAMEAEKAVALPVEIAATIEVGGRTVPVLVEELSTEGALVSAAEPVAVSPAGAGLALVLPWLGRLPVTRAVALDGRLSLHFAALEPATAGSMARLLARFEIFDLPFLGLAEETAGRIAGAFQAALDGGRIGEGDLFDENYVLVEGSNPAQHLTRFTAFTDQVLPPIQEPAAKTSGRILAVCAVDRNGYLPTHMLQFSQPQGSDPAWNSANCRNHRLFNDRVGLAAGRNREQYLLQTYMRETGVGQMEILKDLSVPLWVRGRHWGGLRVTYRF